MASAAEISRRLSAVTNITMLREMVYQEILANEHILKDLKEEEFKVGNIYGNNSNAFYKDYFYAAYKNQKNPLAGFGNVDLINEGDFIESFKLNKPKQNRYRWGATDKKRNMLVKDYGDGIMGMNQETFEKFQLEVVKPAFLRSLQKRITG